MESKNCSTCKFGFKSEFICVCTRNLTKEQYGAFREAVKTMKSDFKKFHDEFLANNLTSFSGTCDQYSDKPKKKSHKDDGVSTGSHQAIYKQDPKVKDKTSIVATTEKKEALNQPFANLDKMMSKEPTQEEPSK